MLKFLRPKILPEEYYEAEIENDNESILIYMDKYRNCPSIKFIKSKKSKPHFHFQLCFL